MERPLPPTFWSVPVEDDPYAIHLDIGAPLDEIEPHTQDVQRAIEEMYAKLPTETRILEGMTIEPYTSQLVTLENELSHPKLTDQQWKNALQSGCSTTDPIHTSEPVSSTSSSSAEHFSPSSDTLLFSGKCPRSQRRSSEAMSVDSGRETDAMNECSECTVPMTSELTPGMPNEAK